MLRSLSAVSRAAAGLPRSIAGTYQLQKRHLPVCIVDTNLPKAQIPDKLATDLTNLVADTLNKPVKSIQVIVNPDTHMVRAGTSDPTCHMNVWSIGVFSETTNPAFAKPFMEFLMRGLDLPHDRVTVFLHPIDKKEAAHVLYGELHL